MRRAAMLILVLFGYCHPLQAKTDYYAVLGIQKTATKVEIDRAYRRLATKFHPDFRTKNQLDEDTAIQKFKEIREAHEVLSNENMRAQYNNGFDPFATSDDSAWQRHAAAQREKEKVERRERARQLAEQYSSEQLQFDSEKFVIYDRRINKIIRFRDADRNQPTRWGWETEEGWSFSVSDGKYYHPLILGAFLDLSRQRDWVVYFNEGGGKHHHIPIDLKTGLPKELNFQVFPRTQSSGLFEEWLNPLLHVKGLSPAMEQRKAELYQQLSALPWNEEQLGDFVYNAKRLAAFFDHPIWKKAHNIRFLENLLDALFENDWIVERPDFMITLIAKLGYGAPYFGSKLMMRESWYMSSKMTPVYQAVFKDSTTRRFFLDGLGNQHEFNFAALRAVFPVLKEHVDRNDISQLVWTITHASQADVEKLLPEVFELIDTPQFASAVCYANDTAREGFLKFFTWLEGREPLRANVFRQALQITDNRESYMASSSQFKQLRLETARSRYGWIKANLEYFGCDKSYLHVDIE